jgi:DNA-directed RNA polymerase subunit RPC12/RpoP
MGSASFSTLCTRCGDQAEHEIFTDGDQTIWCPRCGFIPLDEYQRVINGIKDGSYKHLVVKIDKLPDENGHCQVHCRLYHQEPNARKQWMEWSYEKVETPGGAVYPEVYHFALPFSDTPEQEASMAQVDLMGISSECIRISGEVEQLWRGLEDNPVRTPREDKVYLHLMDAYQALREAISDCQGGNPDKPL